MYTKIDVKNAYRVFTGGPLVTISTLSAEGTADIMTAAWSCPFDSDELLLVLSTEHTTSENIRNGSKIVVALPSKEQVNEALKAGSVHGRDVGDKFKAQSLESVESELFKIPSLKNALAYFEGECSDLNLFKDKGICLLKVKNVYARTDMWNAAEENFNPGCFNTMHHVSSGIFASGADLIKG